MYVEWRRQMRAGMRRSLAAGIPLYERTKLFRLYEPGLVPGLFQTAEYARAVIATFLEFSGAATDLDDAVAARMEWQKIIYEDRRFLVVLEEQALSASESSRARPAGSGGRGPSALLPRLTWPPRRLRSPGYYAPGRGRCERAERGRAHHDGRGAGVPGVAAAAPVRAQHSPRFSAQPGDWTAFLHDAGHSSFNAAAGHAARTSPNHLPPRTPTRSTSG